MVHYWTHAMLFAYGFYTSPLNPSLLCLFEYLCRLLSKKFIRAACTSIQKHKQKYDKNKHIVIEYLSDTTNQKSTRRIPSHGNGLIVALMVGARRAVVTAPSGAEVRDALALCRVLARLFALFNVRQFARRCFNVCLSGTSVALDLGADLHPYASYHVC